MEDKNWAWKVEQAAPMLFRGAILNVRPRPRGIIAYSILVKRYEVSGNVLNAVTLRFQDLPLVILTIGVKYGR